MQKSKLKKSDRVSPKILATELGYLQRLIEAKNYGYGEELIEQICSRLENYDWEKIREAENEQNR